MLERMKPVTALVTQDVREISFPVPEKMLSPPIIAVDNVSVGYDPKKPVLNRVTLRIDTDDRIALLGSNGNGKSTLLKLMPDATETQVRGRTGAIGFSGKAGDTKVKSLSGGEKARLLLGLATFFGPNLIILA